MSHYDGPAFFKRRKKNTISKINSENETNQIKDEAILPTDPALNQRKPQEEVFADLLSERHQARQTKKRTQRQNLHYRAKSADFERKEKMVEQAKKAFEPKHIPPSLSPKKEKMDWDVIRKSLFKSHASFLLFDFTSELQDEFIIEEPSLENTIADKKEEHLIGSTFDSAQEDDSLETFVEAVKDDFTAGDSLDSPEEAHELEPISEEEWPEQDELGTQHTTIDAKAILDELLVEDEKETKITNERLNADLEAESTLVMGELSPQREQNDAINPIEQVEPEKTIPKLAERKTGLGHRFSLGELIHEEEKAAEKVNFFHENEPVIPSAIIEKDEADVERSSEKELAAYHFPSLDLLPEAVTDDLGQDDWVEQQIDVLTQTFSAFNVDATVSDWTVGPAVTQFEITIGLGVKVNKITNLADDLKLALAAKDIRIEAPIPGKNTIGIEIPNLKSRPVMLSEVMHSDAFKESKSPLTVALGVDLFGNSMVTTLDQMPHGLVAGATGSGKSVFINSLLISLLYKATPSEVRLILIDPKAVELAPYNDLPHLLSPVISEPKAASEALKWAVNEMEERYQRLAAAGVRNIKQFNQKAVEHQDYGLKMAYIVIIIDELADLMMVASSEVQDYIARITQKARAAGIHLIVATQRPSVDVITGTIKNNIPTRIAFMVSSQIDSRTIIDTSGAEKLLGKGDMLYLGNGRNQPVRIQGTYVEDEIDDVIAFVKEQRGPNYQFEPAGLMADLLVDESQDELFDEALEKIVEEDTISTSKLQRTFSIGYNRAANLIDDLEEKGFISKSNGSKPREVYLTAEKLAHYKAKKEVSSNG